MTHPFRIIIVGGGIAGLTAAIALRRPNRRITVLEQSSLNREIGALISLQPNASKIVEHMWKLGPELADARGMVDQGFRMYSTDGELAREIPLRTEQFGADRVMYHRRDLHHALKMAAVSTAREGDPVELCVSSRVVSCDPDAGAVVLENGERLEADLIVGADGIHSALRKFVLDGEVVPKPTGLSAYRLMIPCDILEEKQPDFCRRINPRSPYTSMMVAHDCRLIMGPGRQGEVYGIVAIVPDDKMHEDPNAKQSWVSEGNMEDMLQTFAEFPTWVTDIFKHSPDMGLWQLRDLDPLERWHRGKLMLIGDASHAMLPTQGQGASQAIEDAEALGAFFESVHDRPSHHQVEHILEEIQQCRYSRVSLIQAYSRHAAKPGTVKGGKAVTMKPDEFMAFNCQYSGANDWVKGGGSIQA